MQAHVNTEPISHTLHNIGVPLQSLFGKLMESWVISAQAKCNVDQCVFWVCVLTTLHQEAYIQFRALNFKRATRIMRITEIKSPEELRIIKLRK